MEIKESIRGKKNGYSNRTRLTKLHKRQSEADIRNEKWAAMSRESQIKSLQSRRGESKKQIEKIEQWNKNR